MVKTVTELKSQLEYIKYSKEEEHQYSEGVSELFDLATSYVYDAEKSHTNGKKAVWTAAMWEAPFIYAADHIPVSYTELGRLGSHEVVRTAENQFQLPAETCSMVKAVLGELSLRKDKINLILGNSGNCEPFNLAWEILKNEGYDVHYIDTTYRSPNCTPVEYEELVQHLMNQISLATKWLSGNDIDEKKLSFEIKRRNEAMRKVRRVMELRLKSPLYMRSLPTMFMLMGSGHYFGKPEQYIHMLDSLIEELEKEAKVAHNEPFVPLVWAGGRGQEFGVYKAIDDANGAILGWVIPTPFARDYNENLPPLESVARYFLDGQTAGSNRFQNEAVKNQVNKVNARGIVFYGYVGCSFSGIQREMQRQHFKDLGFPSITLEGSFQVGPPSGQLLTRVRAFTEMLA
ncbi:2-hydroxyacyl-CoA dehydratase [Methanosphaerula subterraneus]|uniref:2-hydroxyacyl-CoA dehydratase n=1 Tax=Methanosphaerula subterraneus TaxID=3350244 RepID=UPI003F831603